MVPIIAAGEPILDGCADARDRVRGRNHGEHQHDKRGQSDMPPKLGRVHGAGSGQGVALDQVRNLTTTMPMNTSATKARATPTIVSSARSSFTASAAELEEALCEPLCA